MTDTLTDWKEFDSLIKEIQKYGNQVPMEEWVTKKDKRIAELESELKEALVQVACRERYLVATEIAECRHIEEERKWKERAEEAENRIEELEGELESVVTEALVIDGISESTPNAAGSSVSTEPSASSLVSQAISICKKRAEKAEVRLDAALDVCRELVQRHDCLPGHPAITNHQLYEMALSALPKEAKP